MDTTTLVIVIVVSVSVGLLCLLVIWRERTGLYYYITLYASALVSRKHANTSGLATPTDVINICKKLLWTIPDLSKYTMIDFGCGEGDVINRLHSLFHKSIGVELEENQCKGARERFQHVLSIKIVCADMTTYAYDNVPTVLFLYEPLWDVSDSKFERQVYDRVFSHLQKTVSASTYVLYVTGVNKKALSPVFFANHGLSVVAKEQNPRLLFKSNDVYLLKRD